MNIGQGRIINLKHNENTRKHKNLSKGQSRNQKNRKQRQNKIAKNQTHYNLTNNNQTKTGIQTST